MYPSDVNKYLEMSGGSERLRENMAYFDQIQGQMAIMKRNWCSFYAYTQTGQYIEKIDFNQVYWEKIISNLVWFYEKYLVAAENESVQHHENINSPSMYSLLENGC